jgi:hypothetical protein
LGALPANRAQAIFREHPSPPHFGKAFHLPFLIFPIDAIEAAHFRDLTPAAEPFNSDHHWLKGIWGKGIWGQLKAFGEGIWGHVLTYDMTRFVMRLAIAVSRWSWRSFVSIRRLAWETAA